MVIVSYICSEYGSNSISDSIVCISIILSFHFFNCARSTFASVSCRGSVTFQELQNGLFVFSFLENKYNLARFA